MASRISCPTVEYALIVGRPKRLAQFNTDYCVCNRLGQASSRRCEQIARTLLLSIPHQPQRSAGDIASRSGCVHATPGPFDLGDTSTLISTEHQSSVERYLRGGARGAIIGGCVCTHGHWTRLKLAVLRGLEKRLNFWLLLSCFALNGSIQDCNCCVNAMGTHQGTVIGADVVGSATRLG